MRVSADTSSRQLKGDATEARRRATRSRSSLPGEPGLQATSRSGCRAHMKAPFLVGMTACRLSCD